MIERRMVVNTIVEIIIVCTFMVTGPVHDPVNRASRIRQALG